jgi:hypothetical protein
METQWTKISEKLPKPGKPVITWNGSAYRICVYEKVLTWKGYKFKFVNLMSNGFWNDDETHWMYFPSPPDV